MNSEAEFGAGGTKLSDAAQNKNKILSLQSKQEKDKIEDALNELTEAQFVLKTKEDYLLTYEEPANNEPGVPRKSSINIGQIIGSTGLVSQFMIDEQLL